MNRQQRRAMNKHMGKDATENLTEKISQFGNLPQQCNACNEPFNKKDKDMVNSWSVVVKQEVVRLFCPHCIQKTQKVLENERG
jgi:Zn finger protein HypA/HybF involved in hydrogenase expression